MAQPLDPSSLVEGVKITTQDYSKKPIIDGVKIIDLRAMTDDGGSFMELARFRQNGAFEALPDFTPAQSSFSEVLPGAIKAFHLHFNQEDVWFVPPTHRLLIGLYDIRKDSPTAGQHMRFVMGGGKSQLLYIPRGVAHGGGNLWNQPAFIFYWVNQQFSLENPDERRVAWDALGADFWTITQG